LLQNFHFTPKENKDLTGIPWALAFSLRSRGWYLRQDIVWHKPNAMPESVTDRCTKSHEYIFLLSKSMRYYFDHNAIREPYTGSHFATFPPDLIRPCIEAGCPVFVLYFPFFIHPYLIHIVFEISVSDPVVYIIYGIKNL
jgi:hypothetical protein